MGQWIREYKRLRHGRIEKCTREEWEKQRAQQSRVVAESVIGDVYKVITEFDGDLSWYDSCCDITFPFVVRVEGPQDAFAVTERSGQMQLDATVNKSMDTVLTAHFLMVRLLEKCMGAKAISKISHALVGDLSWWEWEQRAEIV